eukprot:UN04727
MGLGKTLECLALIACNKRVDKCSTSKKNIVAFKETAIRKSRVEVKDNKKINVNQRKSILNTIANDALDG